MELAILIKSLFKSKNRICQVFCKFKGYYWWKESTVWTTVTTKIYQARKTLVQTDLPDKFHGTFIFCIVAGYFCDCTDVTE